jgi:hypothetical protein
VQGRGIAKRPAPTPVRRPPGALHFLNCETATLCPGLAPCWVTGKRSKALALALTFMAL